MHDVATIPMDDKVVPFQRRHRDDRLTPFIRLMLDAARAQRRLLAGAERDVRLGQLLAEKVLQEIRRAGAFMNELVRAARNLPGDLTPRERRWIEVVGERDDEFTRRYWAVVHTMRALRTGIEAGAANHNARRRKTVSA
jgi:hypothetical protein